MSVGLTSTRIHVGGGAAPILAQVYDDASARPAPLVLHLRSGAFLGLAPGDKQPAGRGGRRGCLGRLFRRA